MEKMADNISLTDEDLRMLGLEVEESTPKMASPSDPGGEDKKLTQEEIDAMIASMGK
jgi:hypothetical protein